MSVGPRVVVLGDSWIHGLGPERRRSFARLLGARLGAAEVLDLSAISRTVPELVEEYLDAVAAFRPDVAIMSLGGADSLVFPPAPLQRVVDRYAPPDWHGLDKLQPRVRYARQRSLRWRQRIEYVCKALVKQISVNLSGGRRRVDPAELEQGCRTVLTELQRLGTHIVCVGFGPVTHFASPKTSNALRDTSRMTARILAEISLDGVFVDLHGVVHCWDDYWPDRVHLNTQGHAHVAEHVEALLRRRGAWWTEWFDHAGPATSTRSGRVAARDGSPDALPL